MGAGAIITASVQAMSGILGAMCLALEKKRPVPKPVVKDWIARLRKAADTLEQLVK